MSNGGLPGNELKVGRLQLAAGVQREICPRERARVSVQVINEGVGPVYLTGRQESLPTAAAFAPGDCIQLDPGDDYYDEFGASYRLFATSFAAWDVVVIQKFTCRW